MAEIRIGVYVCHCGMNIAGVVDVKRVVDEIKKMKNVVVARDYVYMCSDPGQDLIKKDIKEYNLNRVVVASCSPRMHEPTFRNTIKEAGLNPYLLEMANIREQDSWVTEDKEEATKKAISLVRIAVLRASLLEELYEKEVTVIPRALVIGGGIAGIQAALDIANAGYEVYLVEKEPSIGGHMAQLEKTFPTLDCSACILTPKMVEVSKNPYIKLYTYCEIEDVSGFVGNFKVKIKKKAKYVDWNRCIACGLCSEKCPKKIPSEFDCRLKERKAIYTPFAQAVPNKPVIDRENCIYFRTGRCRVCEKVCPTGAVKFDDEDNYEEINFGAIVVATGYEEFDPRLKPEFGYGRYKEVLTGLEFERILNASGPTFGEIKINGKVPKSIVFIHCVGSRDEQVGNPYCSRVCCMYIAKQAHLVKERLPDCKVTVFYIDVRAFGKGFEEFYTRVKDEGVIYRRGSPSEIYKRGDKLVVRSEDTILGEIIEEEADLVVLGTGLVPRKETLELAKKLKLSLSADNFLLEAHPKLRPVDSNIDGVYLCGCCQGPKDIPDSVAQAKGAASSVIALFNKRVVTVEPIQAYVREDYCSGCHICEGLCPYSALEFDSEKRVMRVNEALCRGCGVCPSACPSGAIVMRHYTDEQIEIQVGGLLWEE
ncbi:MAG: CoB--CoM heterodisulfide reductase iron-sulfur subunit A family protein [candidate division WOR-3 bacterium]